MNHLFTDYAKSLYDDNVQLDARLMVKVLHVSLQALTIAEVSIKKLSKLFNLDVDEVYMNKRFDFVDVTNKRVYEFDGDHHFMYVDHFHGKYANFVKQHRRDMLKQKFIVENGFDLVRVTGKLTVHQFIDIIMKSNLQSGQSLFIENSDYRFVNTCDLTCELNLVDMLQTENAHLRQEIRELKRRYNVNDWDNIQVDENDDDVEEENDDVNNSELVDEFIEEIVVKIDHLGIIPLKILFEGFNKWCSKNLIYSDMKLVTFDKEIQRIAELKHFKFEPERKRYNIKKHPRVKVINYILDVKDESLANEQQAAISFGNEITAAEINEFIATHDSIEDFTEKQLQIFLILLFEHKKAEFMPLYNKFIFQ